MMKAILVNQENHEKELYLGEVNIPEISDEEVLIKIKACSVNRADLLQREGKYPPPQGASTILGLDCSGVIEKIGSKVTGYKVGDPVMALLSGGGYAEYVNVHHQLLLPIPKNLNFIEASAIPEVFLTAYQAIFTIGSFKENQTILIHAGASGVGQASIQLAKLAKAKNIIITAGSLDKIQFCKNLGANHGINYHEGPFLEDVLIQTSKRGVDLILDFIGAPYLTQNLKALDTDGKLILIAGMGGFKTDNFNILPFLLKRVQIIGTTLRSRDLQYKIDLTENFKNDFLTDFENEKLKPNVDQIFKITQANQAHQFMKENKNKGKIILSWDS